MMQCVYMTTPTSWLCWTSVPMSCKVLKLSTFTEPNSTTRSPTLSPCIGPGRTMKSLYQKWLHRSLVCTCVCVSLSLSFSLSLFPLSFESTYSHSCWWAIWDKVDFGKSFQRWLALTTFSFRFMLTQQFLLLGLCMQLMHFLFNQLHHSFMIVTETYEERESHLDGRTTLYTAHT